MTALAHWRVSSGEEDAGNRAPAEPGRAAQPARPSRADGACHGDCARGDDPVVVVDRVLEVVGGEDVQRCGRHGDEEPPRREQAEPSSNKTQLNE